MKKFVALYFFFLALLFTFFYVETSFISTAVNQGQTNLTLYFLRLFLKPGQVQDIDIWINPHYRIYISQACNGFIPIFFVWAAILAYPAKKYHKLLWIFMSYAVFTTVNVLRILIVVYFVEQNGGRSNFYWSHDLLGNALLMATGLGLFIVFIKTASRSPSP